MQDCSAITLVSCLNTFLLNFYYRLIHQYHTASIRVYFQWRWRRAYCVCGPDWKQCVGNGGWHRAAYYWWNSSGWFPRYLHTNYIVRFVYGFYDWIKELYLLAYKSYILFVCFLTGSTTADYISEVTTIQYAAPQQEVIICEQLELIDDLISEPLETFSVQLSVITMNINVMFMIDSATITIVDNDDDGK